MSQSSAPARSTSGCIVLAFAGGSVRTRLFALATTTHFFPVCNAQHACARLAIVAAFGCFAPHNTSVRAGNAVTFSVPMKEAMLRA